MRALRYHGPRDLRVEHDIPEPVCLPHQVKVRPAFCGICGTDLHEYSQPTFIPSKDKPHSVTGESMPITIGHEFSGEVVEVGSEVAAAASGGLQIGDRVAVQPTICCHQCAPCREGHVNCCDHAGFVGLSGGGGGMSDFVCVDANFAFKLPDNIPLDVGALVEPLSIGWHAVQATDIKPGQSAVIMGAGPIGLAVVQCLKAKGAKQIIVVEVSTERKKFAKRFGATTVLDPREEDVVKRCKELCDGQGPEFAFDCAGLESSINSASLAIRHKGLVVNVAIWERATSFNFNNLVFGEKRAVGVLGYISRDYEGVIKALASGAMNAQDMITSKIRLDRVVEDGFAALIKDKDRHVKILVDCRSK